MNNIYQTTHGAHFVLEIENKRARCKWLHGEALYSVWYDGSEEGLEKEALIGWAKGCVDTGFHKNEIEAFKLYLKL